MRILVTGAAGFVGFHLAGRLLGDGHEVVGIDNLNTYYDVTLKQARLDQLTDRDGFEFRNLNISDRDGVSDLFRAHRFDRVAHLAAQAGVRHSLEAPTEYVDTKLVGFANILEGCRYADLEHFVYASSSSVYGASRVLPFHTSDSADRPVSLYAATKRAGELMAHSYAHLFGIPSTGLRFFTVYGPWGRPDMAYFKFTRAILAGETIPVFNHGKMKRDFTYVDDAVEGIVRALDRPPEMAQGPPYRVLNLGTGRPEKLMTLIEHIEQALGTTANIEMHPMQAGDVTDTCADVTVLKATLDFVPDTPLSVGIARFVEWYTTQWQNR